MKKECSTCYWNVNTDYENVCEECEELDGYENWKSIEDEEE